MRLGGSSNTGRTTAVSVLHQCELFEDNPDNKILRMFLALNAWVSLVRGLVAYLH